MEITEKYSVPPIRKGVPDNIPEGGCRFFFETISQAVIGSTNFQFLLNVNQCSDNIINGKVTEQESKILVFFMANNKTLKYWTLYPKKIGAQNFTVFIPEENSKDIIKIESYWCLDSDCYLAAQKELNSQKANNNRLSRTIKNY